MSEGPGSPRRRRRERPAEQGGPDPLREDFGPGVAPEPEPPQEARAPASGPIPGIACAGEGCLLKPVADLLGRFTLRMARGHTGSLSRAAFSGLELMRALRDFLDEEIAMAEGGKRAGPKRYEKIRVE